MLELAEVILNTDGAAPDELRRGLEAGARAVMGVYRPQLLAALPERPPWSVAAGELAPGLGHTGAGGCHLQVSSDRAHSHTDGGTLWSRDSYLIE